MNYLSIDYLIVYGFLLITLIIGLWTGRRIKDVKEYILANRTFGTGAIVLTHLATVISGTSILNGPAMIFSDGIIYAIALLGIAISYILTAFLVVPKVAYFKQCLTMGDIMGTLYDEYGKIIAGILGCFGAICRVGVNLMALGIICESLLGIQASWGIIIGGAILAAYSAHGGIKSVTTTDIFQFLIIVVIVPLIAYTVIHRAGGIESVLTQLPLNKLIVWKHKKLSNYLTFFLIASIFPLAMTNPAIIQRFLMGRNAKELKEQRLIAAAFDPVYRLTLTLIAFAALILYPNLEAKQVVPHIISNLLPMGLRGIAIAGLLAITMSTIDSFLHAAGYTAVHDVIKPIFDRKNITINELRWIRFATILISVAAIVVALKSTNIFNVILIALGFTGPLLLFPLLSGIMGLKTDKRSFYVATVATLAAFGLAKLLLPPAQTHLTILISIAANGISFFGMHVIQNKGFAIVHWGQGTEMLWHPRRQGIGAMLKRLFPTPKRIVRYSQSKVAQYGAPYILFGVFFTINYVAPYFMWSQAPAEYNDLLLTVRLIGGFLCGLLLVKAKWPSWLLPYMPTFWHLTVLYCLPFTSTLMFLITQGCTEWLINIAIVIILLFVLVDWLSALMLGALGIGLGFLFYAQFVGSIKLNLELDFTTKYLLLYQGIFGVLIGLVFARRRQHQVDQLVTRYQYLTHTHKSTSIELARAMHHREQFATGLGQEGIETLEEVYTLSEQLDEKAQQDPQAFQSTLSQAREKLKATAAYLRGIIYRIKDYLRLEVSNIQLDAFIQEIKNLMDAQYPALPDLFIHKYSKVQELQGDVAKLKQVLVNSIGYITKYSAQAYNISVTFEDAELTYAYDQHYHRVIDALKITISTSSTGAHTQKRYKAYSPEATKLPQEPQELPLKENRRIVEAHYGVSEHKEDLEKGLFTHTYVIPVRVREVRPKEMDARQMELDIEQPVSDEGYPGAAEQEASLLEAIKSRTNADLAVVHKAIKLIKKYHGPVKRKSGEPFYLHPIAAAQIVLDFTQDEDTIVAALLHDVVEDTPVSLGQIGAMFNARVQRIVDGVTHLVSDMNTLKKVKILTHENINNLIEATEVGVQHVKLADRLHNMRTIQGHSSYEKRRGIAEETLLFFVPMAKHLGLQQAAEELKERSLAVLGNKN